MNCVRPEDLRAVPNRLTWGYGLALVLTAAAAPAVSADLAGKVQSGALPVSGSEVTLYEATGGAPSALATATSASDGSFALAIPDNRTADGSLYLVATGGATPGKPDNPAIALLTVLGAVPPAQVTLNEMTTIAAVWTHNQFIAGTAISGPPLALSIAAGNIPNFVDLSTGGYGGTIQDPLNSSQTPTMANFATLATLLAGCNAQVTVDACATLFTAATPPAGGAPADTLAVAEAIVRFPSHQADLQFALLDAFYPVPEGKILRPTPYLPYLTFAPSAWVLPLKFAGGGVSGGGKLMIDGQGNVWAGSYAGRTIAVFDNGGAPLSPEDGGYNFGGRLGEMQGIIVAPNGDIWAVDQGKSQVVHLPGGDPAKAEFFCENDSRNPLDNPCGLFAPFHLAIDQQDNIWITNNIGSHVSRFPAADPGKSATFEIGYGGSGLAIDSKGNVWTANRFGSSIRARLKQDELMAAYAIRGEKAATEVLVHALSAQKAGYLEGGSLSVLGPDGTEAAFSPITGSGLAGPWAVAVDGNDNVWVSNLVSDSTGIVQVCGVRPETCPPGVTTGQTISPAGGYVGGGMQQLVDIGIGPAGDVWVTNNWDIDAAAFGEASEALSTRGAGQGAVAFFGMAKPVKTPLIGPPRQP